MIAYLKGTLIDKTPGRVVIDTGGVGYTAAIPVSSFVQLGRARRDGRALHPHPSLRRRPGPLRFRLARREGHVPQAHRHLGDRPQAGPEHPFGHRAGGPRGRGPGERPGPDLARARDRQEDGPAHHHGAPGQAGEEGEAPGGQGTPEKEDLLSALQNMGFRRKEAERAVDQTLAGRPSRASGVREAPARLPDAPGQKVS